MSEFQKYFKDISQGVSSSLLGLGLTLKHLFNARHKVQVQSLDTDNYFAQDKGIVTLQYPYEALPIPDNGRNRLHNEIDDCIVCDKCAKICPVDCIDIVAIKSTEEIGLTSDGSSKRLYAATFDIDMAKCCFCGLCTTVCPTECLTMTPTFDYSEFDVRNMNYHFTDLSPEEAIEKQAIYDRKQAEKAAAKLVASPQSLVVTQPSEVSTEVKPAFKPKFPVAKPQLPKEDLVDSIQSSGVSPSVDDAEPKPKPVFKPKMPQSKIQEVAKVETETTPISEISEVTYEEPKPKVVFKPKMMAPKIPSLPAQSEEIVDSPSADDIEPKPKPVFKPKMLVPKIPSLPQQHQKLEEPVQPIEAKAEEPNEEIAEPPKPKVVFKPKMLTPKIPPKTENDI
jgi:formate hydrogenlyase subunit 6/NADH:ubiquinone oxidoreductase subunit I